MILFLFAFINTMHNYNLIIDGLTDLIARIEFVSSLQNSIELIFKQVLLDRNDHSIIEWKLDKISSAFPHFNPVIKCP